MRTILIDGSNVGLYSARSGKLTTLVCLARVVNALLTHQILPYTIFDASFRYRTAENSLARADFTRLIRETGEFFQLAPKGEDADLFLLEAASATGNPILSNDTYGEYGGVKDGVIRYKGHEISVYNFSVIAGSVIIPDLEIRHKTLLADDSLDEIDEKLVALRDGGEMPATGNADTIDEKAEGGHAEIDDDTIKSIDLVVHDYVDGGIKPLNELGRYLVDHKKRFAANAGVGKHSKRIWFGYPTLKSFILNTFPRYKLGDNSIQEGEDTSV
jgi:hypothetical protein